MDPISLLTGGAVLLTGIILGRSSSRRPKLADSTMCAGCEHSITYRDPGTGHCTAQTKQANKWDGVGSPIGYIYVPCTCASHVTADHLLITGWDTPRPALDRTDTPEELP